MQNHGPDNDDVANYEALDENTILDHIKCEITRGVYNALHDPEWINTDGSLTDKANAKGAQSVNWLNTWGAKVSYVFTVDEKGSFNPGLSWKNAYAVKGTSETFGGGIQTSAEAQRKETGAVTYAFEDLLNKDPMKQGLPSQCNDIDGFQIHSDLKIKEFIDNKIFVARVPGTLPKNSVGIGSDKPQVFTAFSDELTFTITYGGSFSPNWTFVRLTFIPSGPLFGDTRTKTQYVTITLGPVSTRSKPGSAAILSPESQQLDSANLTAHAIATAVSRITQ